MQPKIEDLVQQKDLIKSSLENLQKLKEKEEKEKFQKEISEKLTKLKKDIESFETTDDDEKNKLNSLKSDVDKLSEDLKKIDAELKSLEAGVLSSQKTTATQEEKKDKSFRESTKEFVWEQWDKVKSWEAWKEEPWKNILRAVGFWVTWYAIYKWVKSLWNWAFWSEDKEEWEEDEEETSKKKKKKKWFWKTTWGKILKWLGIWVWAGTIWYWLGKKLGFWWEDENKPTDAASDEVKYKAYQEFMKDPNNKEAVENYELLWENVDVTYEDLYSRELQAWYQDELKMKRIAEQQSWWLEKYRWVIPFCLDNKFWSIEDVLSQNSSIRYAMNKWLGDMVRYVKNLGTDFMQSFIDSYLSKLPSWTQSIVNFKWSLNEKLDKWVTENTNAEIELQYFFRQSIRIQTYLFEKKDQLIEKITEEKARSCWMTVEALKNNKEKYENYVLQDWRLQAFLTWSIAWWVNILKEKAIFDSQIWKDVRETKEKLDDERDEVLSNEKKWKDILQIVSEKKEKWEALTQAEIQLLAKSCDKINDDIDNRIMDAVEESAWNLYWDLFRTNDANLRKYLDNSKLMEVFEEYKKVISDSKRELLAWRLSSEKIAALAESINEMLALKKEAVLWAQTIERDYDENWNIIYRIPWFLKDSIANLGKGICKLKDWEIWSWTNYLASAWLWTWIAITATWWLVYIFWGKTAWKQIMKYWVKITALPLTTVYLIWKNAARRTPVWRKLWKKIIYGSPEWIQSMAIFRWEKWPEKLLEALKLDKITLSDAEGLVTRKIKSTWWLQETKDKWCSAFNLSEDNIDGIKVRESVFDKLVKNPTYLAELKANNELYDKAVKYFDESADLRYAVKNWKALDIVENEVNKVESKLAWATDIVDDVVESAELAENITYKKLKNELNSKIEDLKISRDEYAVWSANYKKLDEQISNLKTFQKNIKSASIEEVEWLYWMYTTLIKFNQWHMFFDNIDALAKIMAEESPELHDALNSFNVQKLRAVIEKLQNEKKLKGLTNDAINNITVLLLEIKNKKVLKSWETLVPSLRNFLKYMGRLSKIT